MRIAAVAVLALFLASAAHAQEEAATPRAIFQRHIDASGGAAAHEAVTTQRHTGHVESAAMPGREVPITILVKAPSTMRVVVDLGNLGKIIQAADADAGWSLDPFSGANITPDADRLFMQRGVDTLSMIDPQTPYEDLTLAAREDVETPTGPVPCDRVDFTLNGVQMSEWFAVDSGLRIKRAVTFEGDFGPEERAILYLDWKPVGDGGLLVPHSSPQQAMGADISVIIERVELNPSDLPADAFDVPEAVREKMSAVE